MKKQLLSMALLLFSLTTFGQGAVQATAELNTVYSPVKRTDTSAHVRFTELKLGIPVLKNATDRLSAGFTLTNEHFEGFPATYGEDVYGLALNLNWLHFTGSRTALNIFGQGGIYSDLQVLAGNQIRGMLGASYITRYSANFSLGFGLAYGRQFYGNQIIPLVLVQYRFEDAHWKLGGLFPTNPKLTYLLTQHNALSFEFKQVYSSYRLTGPADEGTFIKNSKLTSMLNYEYSFAKAWRIAAGLGYAVRQRYELYRNGDDSQWYLINSAIGGSKQVPAEAVSRNGAQFHLGIAFNPQF